MAKHLSRRWRVALLAGLSIALLGVALRTAIQRLPWFGPWLAAALRLGKHEEVLLTQTVGYPT